MPSRQTKPKHAAGVNTELFKALSHPLRGRIMVLLTEMQASPKELSERLGETLGNTSYSVRVLKEAGLIELVGTSTHRGGTEHFYRASARPILDLESWETLPKLIREVNSAWVLQLLIGDAVEALSARTFDARTGRTLLRIPIVVDQEGWEEIEPASARYLQEILDVQAKSAARMSESGEKGFNVSASALAFEVPGTPGTDGAPD